MSPTYLLVVLLGLVVLTSPSLADYPQHPPFKKPPPEHKPPVEKPPPEHKPPVEKPPPEHKPPVEKPLLNTSLQWRSHLLNTNQPHWKNLPRGRSHSQNTSHQPQLANHLRDRSHHIMVTTLVTLLLRMLKTHTSHQPQLANHLRERSHHIIGHNPGHPPAENAEDSYKPPTPVGKPPKGEKPPHYGHNPGHPPTENAEDSYKPPRKIKPPSTPAEKQPGPGKKLPTPPHKPPHKPPTPTHPN
ncbi:hypothetical protein CK203_098882 [Vitis vinifera]|uniref:Proline-rich 33 kDa extensin-related protein n=1 Tax=Vitis vinifera TaxID=29760 RepID=A0A438DD83_VITVI|nr:hypothetical protein CK203_098882 [Vitis vinifera]